MKIKSQLLALSILFASHIYSQIQYGPLIGFNYGDLQKDASINFFDTDLATYGGLHVRWNTKSKLYVNTTLSVGKTGWSELFENRDNSNIEEIHLKGNAFALLVEVGYYLIELEKFKFGLAAGLKVATAYNSTFDYYPKTPNSVLLAASRGFQTIEAGADFSYKILDRLSINLSPNYSFRVNKRAREYNFRDLGMQISFLFMGLK